MILVFMETRDGKTKKSSLEALSEALRLSAAFDGVVAAVFAGSVAEDSASEAFSLGAKEVHALENPVLSAYSPESWALALAAIIGDLKPSAVFFSGTAMGRDLAPRLAAKLGVGLVSDCVKTSAREGRIEFTRPVFAGKALLRCILRTVPAMATLRPNVFTLGPATPAGGAVVPRRVDIPEGTVKGKVTEMLKEPDTEIDITEADVIVSGGRGVKGPEGFVLLRDFAAVIPRSAVGASRSAVDSGWIGHAHQVGQTGKTVSPNLYIALGISGAIQHLAGMSGSKFVVAVNKDPEAPIFKVANYGIVGDLFQVLPLLKEEFQKAFV
jgi:electron transfer flavoprotein alpha subunit